MQVLSLPVGDLHAPIQTVLLSIVPLPPSTHRRSRIRMSSSSLFIDNGEIMTVMLTFLTKRVRIVKIIVSYLQRFS